MHRRDFVLSAAATIGVLSSATVRAAANADAQPLGLQLFTVWEQLEHDFEGTLHAIAGMGYKFVETMGAFGRDPKHVRAMLDKYGLTSPSQHLSPSDLYPMFKSFTSGKLTVEQVMQRLFEAMSIDRMGVIVEEGISRARDLGQKYIIWHVTPSEQMATRPRLDEYCRALNAAGSQCAKAGMFLGIHNHDEEFRRINGYIPYDVMIENTDPATVTFELDTCWATAGGGDPVAYLKRYPERFRQLHLKDCSAKNQVAPPGEGVVKFPEVMKAARQAKVENYYVEYDHADDPIAMSRRCFDYFSKL